MNRVRFLVSAILTATFAMQVPGAAMASVPIDFPTMDSIDVALKEFKPGQTSIAEAQTLQMQNFRSQYPNLLGISCKYFAPEGYSQTQLNQAQLRANSACHYISSQYRFNDPVERQLSAIGIEPGQVVIRLTGFNLRETFGAVNSIRRMLSELTVDQEFKTLPFTNALQMKFIDNDGFGCKSDRQILSLASGGATKSNFCAIKNSKIKFKYEPSTVVQANSLEVRNIVSNEEAWSSGAWQWRQATWLAFSNDLEKIEALRSPAKYPDYIQATTYVTKKSSAQLGEVNGAQFALPQGPYACVFLSDWIRVKSAWRLTVDSGEKAVLESGISKCAGAEKTVPSYSTRQETQGSNVDTRELASPCKISGMNRGVNSFGFPRSADRFGFDGNSNIQVLFVDFPDVAFTEGMNLPREEAVSIFEPVEDFWTEMSRGQIKLKVTVHPRYIRMSKNIASYGLNTRDWGYGRLKKEAVLAADRFVDFSNTRGLIIVVPPTARESQASFGHEDSNPIQTDEGVIREMTWFGGGQYQDSDRGILIHEVGHMLGLPDLYDYQPGVGTSKATDVPDFLDVMAGFGHIYKMNIFEFVRWQFGWIRDTAVECLQTPTGQATLTPSAVEPNSTNLLLLPLGANRVIGAEVRTNLCENCEPGVVLYEVDAFNRSEVPIRIYRKSVANPQPGGKPAFEKDILLTEGDVAHFLGKRIEILKVGPVSATVKYSSSSISPDAYTMPIVSTSISNPLYLGNPSRFPTRLTEMTRAKIRDYLDTYPHLLSMVCVGTHQSSTTAAKKNAQSQAVNACAFAKTVRPEVLYSTKVIQTEGWINQVGLILTYGGRNF